jgi:hypothetical protein
MKDTYTLLETIETSDGNTVIYNPLQVTEFFRVQFEQNFSKMSFEEKHQCFKLQHNYKDLVTKLYEPLQEIVRLCRGADWALQNSHRNPTEEYDYQLSLPKDEDFTDEENQLIMERFRLRKEWFEQQNQ